MAEERIDVTLELHDALSRPAGRAENAIEDLGDEVEQLAVKEELATQATSRLDRALDRLDRVMGRFDKTTNKATRSTKEHRAETEKEAKALKALEANAKAAASKGVALLGKAFKILKLPVILSLVQLLAGGISSMGAAGFAAVAQLAPLVGVLGAMPALLGAILGGALALKLGFGGMGEALKVMTDPTASLEKQAEALNKLSPAARSFVRTLAAAKKETDGWKQSIQEAAFPQLEATMHRLEGIFPRVERGLAGNASAMGDLAYQTGSYVASSGRDVTKIFNSNERIIRRGLTPALVAFVGIFLDFMVAGAPLAQRFADWMGTSATKVADLVDEGRRTGKLQDFLMRAGDLAANVGKFLGNVAVALFNIGRESDALLTGGGLGQMAADWADWTKTVEGKDSIRKWFADASPLVSELGRTVKILAKGFLDLAGNGAMTNIIRQINDDLLPSIMDLSQTASESLIPALIKALDVFVDLETGLGQSPLPQFLMGIVTAAGLVVDVFNALPGPVRYAVAALLVAKTASTLLKVPFTQLAALGPKVRSSFADVRAGAQLYSEGMTGVQRASGMARGAMVGLKGAGAGLLGVFGGPWGLAITAATVGLGYFMAKQRKSKEYVANLTAAIDKQTGAMSDQGKEMVVQELESKGLLKAADELGISYSTVTAAALGNKDAMAEISAVTDVYTTKVQRGANETGRAAGTLSTGLTELAADTDSATAAARRQGEALKDYKPKADAASSSTGIFGDHTAVSADAAERQAAAVDASRRAIIKLDDVLVGQQRTWIGFRQNVSDAKKELTKGKLTLNTYTQAGRDNKSALLDVAEAASQVENKAARTHAIKEAKEFITRWADAAGMGHKQAKAYADSLFDLGEKARDLPKEAKTDVKVTGLDTVLGRMRDLNAYADALNGRTIHMDTRLDRGTPARKDGGAVWQMQDFRVGEVGPEMFVGASGNVGIIGEHGPTTMRFAEPGVVIPNDALPNWVTDRLERPAYATATAPAAAAGGDTVPDVHLHFHGDQGQPTPAELEAMIIAAWRRYERERKERS